MTNRSHDDHNEWHELVAGQALDALDPADEARLLNHLDGCEDCRIELDGHSLTASHLASLADDAETAPPSWSKIRAGVVGDAPLAVAVLADRRERKRPAPWLLAAAAAVVVIAGATVAGLQVLGSGHPAASAIEQCHVTLGCQEIDLRSSKGSSRAAVLVSKGVAQVQPIALSGPSAGRTFVLWQLPRSGAPIALTEFGSSSDASSPSALAVSMAQTTAFAVSSEPVGIAPKKPTDVLALGGVTS
ncbi:MAG TPA: anti-sigma factor [Mycobacteriales bacterium]|jgi:anti-sigma-K factor RskA|nr:anti-sigma factor [Mycobacteriales bacterium]